MIMIFLLTIILTWKERALKASMAEFINLDCKLLFVAQFLTKI